MARLAVVCRYLLLLLVLYHEHLLPLFVPISIWCIYWWFATGKLRVSLPIDAPVAAYLLLGYITTIFSANPASGMLELIYTPCAVAVLYRVAYGLRSGEFERPAVVRLITTAAMLIMAESSVRLAGRAAGIDWIWHTEDCPWCDAYARSWRVWLWAGDWMTYTLILLVAVAVGPPWLLLPAAFTMFWSGSRSAWLSFIALLLAGWRGHNDRWLRDGAAALLAVLFVSFAPLVLSDRAAPAAPAAPTTGVSVSVQQITTDSGRMAFLREAAATWLQSPLWGSGWGSYWFSSGLGHYETFHPHNHVAYIATSHGAIGVVLIVIIVLTTIQHCIETGDREVAAAVAVVMLYSLLNTIICSMLVAVAVVMALAWGNKNGVAPSATP